MEKEKQKKLLRLLSAKGTEEILEFLNEHDTAQFKDLNEFTKTTTLITRLDELLAFKLIQHHISKVGKRKEWYTLTDKGKIALKCLYDLGKLVMELS